MKNNALPRSEKLKKKDDFERLFRRGTRFRGKVLTIHVLQGKRPGCRVAFVASRRIGHAVQRNRAKRLLREAYRKNRRAFPRGMDIALTARKEIIVSKSVEVESEVSRLVEEIQRA